MHEVKNVICTVQSQREAQGLRKLSSYLLMSHLSVFRNVHVWECFVVVVVVSNKNAEFNDE